MPCERPYPAKRPSPAGFVPASSAVPGFVRASVALCALCLALLLGCPARAAPAGAAQPARAQLRITVEAPVALRAALEQGLDLARWQRLADARQAQLGALRLQLARQTRQLLEALGYFSSRVQVALQGGAASPRVVVRVEPGPPTRVAQVKVRVRGPQGQPMPTMQQALLRDWKLPVGKVFVSAQWRQAKADALLHLSTRRYAAARLVSSRALVDPARQQARLYVDFDSGPSYRFGVLRVQGLHRYPESVVRNLVAWRPGEVYSQTRLLQLQARLQNTRYFRYATVAAPLADAQGDELPVLVDVAEQRAQKLGLGIGYSSNTRARTQFDYSNLDLFGRAWRLDSQIKLETLQQSFHVGLAFPQRPDGSDYSLGVQIQHADIQGLTTRSQTLGLQRQRTRGIFETAESLQFINEQQQISGGSVSSDTALVPGLRWTRRGLDSSLDPTRGSLLELQLAAGLRSLLSAQDFLRIDLHGLQYVWLTKTNQLILRGEIGKVFSASAQGIPQQELFRAGGVGSVRGYAYQSLGVEQGGAVVGGRALLTASVEAVHWLLPRWGAALFVDAGNAADSFQALHPVLGYGVGLRWRSPAGLLSINLAHGRATGATQLEFNVGVSF